MTFEWDPRKSAENRARHGVTFEEAATVFRDRLSATGTDPDHSVDEDRFITFGMSTAGRLLVVAHTNRDDTIRIRHGSLRDHALLSRYKRPEVQHAVEGSTDKQYGDGHNGQILLELEAPVHCDQRVVLTFHAAKKLAVRDARPPAAGHRIDSVTLECRCEV